MKILKTQEIAKLDHDTINLSGIPSLVLMENAGRGSSKIILRKYSKSHHFIIIAGTGNNGGDGLVIARHLHLAKKDLKVFILAEDKNQLSADSQKNLLILENFSIDYTFISERNFDYLKSNIHDRDILIDSIFGTGFKSPARGFKAELIKHLANLKNNIVAIDIPSGLDADSAAVTGPFLSADLCITFSNPKLCHVLKPNSVYCGETVLIDISLNKEYIQNINRYLLNSELVEMPSRKVNAHKYDCGHTLIIGGSSGMSGAVILATSAALRSGTGLCTAIIPNNIQTEFNASLSEAMSITCPESKVSFKKENISYILDIIKKGKYSSIVFGPGISVSEDIQLLLSEVLKIDIPILIDADGLNNLANISGYQKILRNRSSSCILTPHIGEACRLLNIQKEAILADAESHALRLSAETNTTVILKSATTLITYPNRNVYYSIFGNPGMATAGSGDVLAGITGGFLSRLPIENACLLGTLIHGHAGDAAANRLGQEAMIASDIIDYLPYSFSALEAKKKTSAAHDLVLKINEL